MNIRSILEKAYRSPLGRFMSFGARMLAELHKPRMIYGYYSRYDKKFLKYTRISSSSVIIDEQNLRISDYVWVWHYSILDASNGLEIDEGVQIGAWCGIFTHGSQISIRLLGKKFVDIPYYLREGYTRGSVSIGSYTFIGAGSVVLPNVKIGKGCLIGAMSLVNKDIPDFSIVIGQPAKVVGDTRELDLGYFKNKDFSDSYYDAEALAWITERLEKVKK